MKKDVFQIILPLTIICFAFVTKWTFALPEDARDTMYYGFPLIHSGEAWHTSLATQYFVLEFLFDFFFYFLVVFVLVKFLKKYFKNKRLKNIINVSAWSFSMIIISFFCYITFNFDDVFFIKRNHKITKIDSGIHFTFIKTEKPLLK